VATNSSLQNDHLRTSNNSRAEEEGRTMIESSLKNQQRMSRREFDRLDPTERAAVMKCGFQLYDEPEAKRMVLRPGEMFRADFEELSPVDRMDRVRAGIKLID
jgi:hypothetical protein